MPQHRHRCCSLGLALLNHTNLDLCTSGYRAELFRIKAQLLEALGHFNDSQKLFFMAGLLHIPSTAHHKAGRTWLTWARCVDSLWLRPQATENSVDINKEELRKCAFAGYVQGLVQGSKSAKYFVSRILAMVFNKEPHSYDLLKNHLNVVPPRQWLPWIPQLISAMNRPEYDIVCMILALIAATYPQAIYMKLKALERTMSEQYNSLTVKASSSSLEQRKSIELRLEKVDELITFMDRAHRDMAQEAQLLYDELLVLGSSLWVRGELRSGLVVFIQKCESSSSARSDIVSGLDSMCRKMFSDARVGKKEILAQIRDPFLKAFSSPSTSAMSVGDIHAQLLKWLA